jgi:hypothetical protein
MIRGGANSNTSTFSRDIYKYFKGSTSAKQFHENVKLQCKIYLLYPHTRAGVRTHDNMFLMCIPLHHARALCTFLELAEIAKKEKKDRRQIAAKTD